MKSIFLSPHLDDAVYSCGGMIWEQAHAGQVVEVWTICAGDPPDAPLSDFAHSLHARWGTGDASMAARRAEDCAALELLGGTVRHFDLPDCIYRRLPRAGEPLINENDDLWRPLHPQEKPLVAAVSAWIGEHLHAHAADSVLVCPLGIGGHVDHRLVRAAAEALCRPLFYYADYPYAVTPPPKHNPHSPVFSSPQIPADAKRRAQPVSPPALAAWQQAVAAYASQISTFWGSLEDLRRSIREYADGGGSALFELPLKTQQD